MQMTMTLYELTKKHSAGKGENVMWETLQAVSEALERDMDAVSRERLTRKVYGIISDGHYNEEYAREDVSTMYYKDPSGEKHYGPYWPDNDVRALWEKAKGHIPGYCFWDYYVALNMMKADMCRLVESWFPGIGAEEKNRRLSDLAVAFLADEDSPYGMSKIWGYLNPAK